MSVLGWAYFSWVRPILCVTVMCRVLLICIIIVLLFTSFCANIRAVLIMHVLCIFRMHFLIHLHDLRLLDWTGFSGKDWNSTYKIWPIVFNKVCKKLVIAYASISRLWESYAC